MTHSHGSLTWSELPTFANLIATFYDERGRDPIGREYDRIVSSVHTIHDLARMTGAVSTVTVR